MEPTLRSGDGPEDVGVGRQPLIDLLPVAVLLAGPDGAAKWANRAWKQLTGQTEQDWRGAGWFGVGDERERDVRRDQLLAAARSGASHQSDWTVSANGHPRRILHVQAVPEVHRGELVRIVVTAADVTDDRDSSARLLDQATHDSLTGLYNRAQFLEFLQHALDRRRRVATGVAVVLFIDVDHFKAINDHWGHAEGDRVLRDVAVRIKAAVRPADIVARYGGDEFTILCEDVVDIAEAEAIADRIRTIFQGHPARKVSIGVTIMADPDRDVATIVAEADRSMYEAKRVNGRQPVSGRRAAARPLIGTTGASDSREEGAEPDEHEARRLIAVAAHELRTPLATIGGFASTLRADQRRMQAADVERALEIIERQTQRMAVMLDQLLALGQCHNGIPVLETVDLTDVVSDALEAAAPPPHVSVTRTGPPAASLVVTADRSRITRVLVNLLTNAYRYGGPHITVDLHNGTGGVTVSVEDDGSGIPRALGERIFAPFVRGGIGEASPPGGSGLGLALARAIAESAGGHLLHERVEPHGARFLLRLPAAAPNTAPVVTEPAKRSAPAWSRGALPRS